MSDQFVFLLTYCLIRSFLLLRVVSLTLSSRFLSVSLELLNKGKKYQNGKTQATNI